MKKLVQFVYSLTLAWPEFFFALVKAKGEGQNYPLKTIVHISGIPLPILMRFEAFGSQFYSRQSENQTGSGRADDNQLWPPNQKCLYFGMKGGTAHSLISILARLFAGRSSSGCGG